MTESCNKQYDLYSIDQLISARNHINMRILLIQTELAKGIGDESLMALIQERLSFAREFWLTSDFSDINPSARAVAKCLRKMGYYRKSARINGIVHSAFFLADVIPAIAK